MEHCCSWRPGHKWSCILRYDCTTWHHLVFIFYLKFPLLRISAVDSLLIFLVTGYVDKLGVAFEDNTVATGYGAHLAMPLMRAAFEASPGLSEAAAVALLHRCMQVLYYRDARSINKYEIALISGEGVRILPALEAPTTWEIASMVRGYE